MDKNIKILEALQMQPLSEEEMSTRHILGRLYGPIATCIESTRNGRLYNKPLWEKALEDEIFLEKVATKALFLELGHPADREETDMKQACACIPEVPKIVGDDLYAYVDILDTPNGRLLKTLVDYGFVPGISSRGSGDVMENNQVDPETFFLETWDIVQLPAVKKARLNVCESLDSNGIKLKKALAESYKAAKDEDRDTMKKALENLNIDIEEEIEGDSEITEAKDIDVVYAKSIDEVPWDPEMNTLLEDAEEDTDDIEPIEDDSEETDDSATEDTEDAEEVEEVDTDSEETVVDVEGVDEVDLDNVGDAIELLQEYDEDTRVEFAATLEDGEQVPVSSLETFVETDDETDEKVLVITANTGDVATEDSDESADDTADSDIENTEIIVDDEDSETNDVETDDEEDSADDDGDVEVIESLKDLVRQKEALETEVGALRKAKAVGDAKETELQEKLTRYRTVFKQLNTEAAKVSALENQVQHLTEQLSSSKSAVKTLKEKLAQKQKLQESVSREQLDKTNSLTAKLSEANKLNEDLKVKLEGQTEQYNRKLKERTEIAKAFKARFLETLNRYVESKASMLGVKPSEITNRLNESYTLADVDAVCDQILDSTVNISRLPFSGRTKTTARIAESVSKPVVTNPEHGYDIDDDLLELAGLKSRI